MSINTIQKSTHIGKVWRATAVRAGWHSQFVKPLCLHARFSSHLLRVEEKQSIAIHVNDLYDHQMKLLLYLFSVFTGGWWAGAFLWRESNVEDSRRSGSRLLWPNRNSRLWLIASRTN